MDAGNDSMAVYADWILKERERERERVTKSTLEQQFY
jgi:hypothetical protein